MLIADFTGKSTMQQETVLETQQPDADGFFFLKIRPMLRYFKTQHFSFWMICFYLFFEYSRPQLIFPVIDFLPWTRLFLIGALIGSFLDSTCSLVKSRASILIILFAISILLSSIFAVYPRESSKHFIDFYSWVLIYFLITTIVNTRERFYLFQMVFILSALKIAIGTSFIWAKRGFSFTSWGLMGPPGFFCNSGELSILMLTLFPFGILLLLNKKMQLSLIEKILLICSLCCPLLTILGGSSRGSQIAMVGIFIILFRKKIFKPKFLIITIFLIISINKLLPEEQKNRFSNMGNDNTSIQRKLYWKHGLEMIQEHPILGVGFFNFQSVYTSKYRHDLVVQAVELPHNIFIQVGTDAGLMGLIPFSLLLLYSIITSAVYCKRSGKTTNDLIVLCMVGSGYGILGFIIAGQFVTVAYYPFLWIGLSFIVAAKNILQKESVYYRSNQRINSVNE
jgi:putative inorganic carbon (hco3(-)) transporter